MAKHGIAFTVKAEEDLAGIADYTITEFGIEQARLYRDQFEACFASLQDNPLLGQSAERLAPRMRRIRQQAHMVFYRAEGERVLIVRVLHARMEFARHLRDVG